MLKIKQTDALEATTVTKDSENYVKFASSKASWNAEFTLVLSLPQYIWIKARASTRNYRDRIYIYMFSWNISGNQELPGQPYEHQSESKAVTYHVGCLGSFLFYLDGLAGDSFVCPASNAVYPRCPMLTQCHYCLLAKSSIPYAFIDSLRMKLRVNQ